MEVVVDCRWVKIEGLWFGGYGFRSGAKNSGFRVQGSRVQGSGFRVQGSGFRAQGSGFRVQGSGFRVTWYTTSPRLFCVLTFRVWNV